jgi:hypothetical protein
MNALEKLFDIFQDKIKSTSLPISIWPFSIKVQYTWYILGLFSRLSTCFETFYILASFQLGT